MSMKINTQAYTFITIMIMYVDHAITDNNNVITVIVIKATV